ncbi:MAG: di-trans,poly-cis-decaprenylcistransferase [Oscillospiraceae bacterium]|jgi:undecaprenyl diphosphate synthase|nr:di-trans,poly-cis-decaprenylcistransferase [Oscillospiraceae bacterium]
MKPSQWWGLIRRKRAAPAAELAADALPRHVAIIMDGNGRWAKRRMLPRELGHRAGVESMRAIIRESGRLGIAALTLYAFSTENWSRSDEEVSALMGLMLECFRKEAEELNRSNVRVRVIGDTSRLSAEHRGEIARVSKLTGRNSGLQLNLALNYGGRDEIVRAVRKLVDDGVSSDKVNEKTFADALDTAGLPDVDLVIRTSGEMRMSNFLPYLAAYAEYVAPETLWPDYSVEEYHKSLAVYAGRSRRFGGRPAK